MNTKYIVIFVVLSSLFNNLKAQTPVTEIYSTGNFYSSSLINTSNYNLPSGMKYINNTYNLLAFKSNNLIFTTGYSDDSLINNSKYQTTTTTKVSGKWEPFMISGFPTGINLGSVFVGIGTAKSSKDNAIGAHSQYLPLQEYVSSTNNAYKLDMGSGIYNIPNATILKYAVLNLNQAFINDNVPDILISQIGEISPSASDTLYFTDEHNQLIGNKVVVNMANIHPTGIVQMNFYNASDRTFNSGTTSNEFRYMRLATFELGAFNIPLSQIGNIKYFNHKLSGTTDQAFILYNKESFSASTSLPIKVLSFEGHNSGFSNDLKWKTGTITNGKSIEVERSIDGGQNWTSIYEVSVALNTDLVNEYEYKDFFYNNGPNLYRLKLNDIDQYSYSKVISIFNKKAGNNISIYPNPTKDILYLSDNVKYQVINTMGHTIENGQSNMINMTNYNNGVYYILIDNISYKVIKQ